MAELSKEYASALFSLALEGKKTQLVSDELVQILNFFEAENGAYIDFLNAPSIPKEERLNALDQSLKSFDSTVRNFVKLLCEKRHIRIFRETVEEYNLLYRASARISLASVSSAVELTEAQKAKLVKKLEEIAGHEVIVFYSLDPSLIAGMVVEMDSKVYDRSLKKDMKEVKEVIAK